MGSRSEGRSDQTEGIGVGASPDEMYLSMDMYSLREQFASNEDARVRLVVLASGVD